jgi:5'-nucleotidase
MRQLLCAVILTIVAVSPLLAADAAAPEPYHVMLVNDDGVDAPGLAALAEVLAADSSYRVTIVAPLEHQSGKGHALVIRGEIPAHEREPIAGCTTWAVDATPATVTRVGLSALLADDPPSLVISGINKGENVGRIAWYSGTVGAAREAVMAGFNSIAFSLQLDWENPKPDFATAAALAKTVVDSVRQHGLPEGVYLNVNIPLVPKDAKGYRLSRMGLAPDQLNAYEQVREEDGVRYYKSRWFPPADLEDGTDNLALREGWVTLVPLSLDATDYSAIPVLQDLRCLVTVPAAVQ